jgi:hypothetical protein
MVWHGLSYEKVIFHISVKLAGQSIEQTIVNCSSKRSLRWTIVIIGNEDEHQLTMC